LLVVNPDSNCLSVADLDTPPTVTEVPIGVDPRTVAVDDAYARSLAKGYVPFCTVRDLDQLTINPGHEPD